MNDFEDQLRELSFRQPSADLRETVLGYETRVTDAELRTWRDWMWPSPVAWAALAAIWVGLALWDDVDRAPGGSERVVKQEPSLGGVIAAHASLERFLATL